MAKSKIKFIQINIYKGKYLVALIDFLKERDPDIISAQEVTVGELNFWKDSKANLFRVLKEELGLNGVYHGDLRLRGDSYSRLGNAVFSKFPIKNHKVVALKKFRPVTLDELDGSGAFVIRPQISRHLLDAVIDVDGVGVHAISIHGAWTAPPADTQENLRQAKVIVDYLKSLGNEPFIMGGDLNMPPGTRVIEMISKVAKNLMLNSGVVQTTHPKIHVIAPRGFLVDYIFVSDHFKVKSLEAPEMAVSDHLPVIAELEFNHS